MSISYIKNTYLKYNMTPTSFVDMLKTCPHQKVYMEDVWDLHSYPDYPSGVGTSSYFKIIVLGSGQAKYAKVILFTLNKVFIGRLNTTEDGVDWIYLNPS